MEGPTNGGLLYHEVQESKLCAVHCVNTILQGPFFTELDLAALASDLDQKERQMMTVLHGNDFLSEDSHNVSMGGDFSIQVLEKALEVWDLKVIPLDSPVAEPSKHDPELENAYICHLQNHWFCIRKVNGEWYNFNSLYPAPEHLTKFYLSAYLDTLKSSGWSIFLVRGNFPKDCPMSSTDSSYGFGQWLTPEDAKGITNSCNQREITQRIESPQHNYSQQYASDRDSMSQQEQDDLAAAIQASLMDTVALPCTLEQISSIPAGSSSNLADQCRTTDQAEASSQSSIHKNNDQHQPDPTSASANENLNENKREVE